MVVSYSGIAGARGSNPTAIVLHNDAGSQGATAAFYKNWLESHTPSLGFAHYYVASDGTYQAEKDSNKAWHTGNSKGNANYLGIEVCQSMGNESTYLANEQKAFKLAADLCKKYGLNPASAVFPLHRELSATSCPHRAWDLHGKGVAAIKKYFVDQIKKYYSGDSTSNNNSGSSNSTVKPNTPSTKPSYITLSLDGKFGPGTARRLQQYFGTTQDGVISHQYKQKFNQNIYAAQFDQTLRGSNAIRALQKLLGVSQDGLMGQATIKALQKRLGTTQDGIISPVSNVVKALQQSLNNNKL